MDFDLQLHRGALDRHVQRYFKTQLQEQVALTVCGEQKKGFIRQTGHNTFSHVFKSGYSRERSLYKIIDFNLGKFNLLKIEHIKTVPFIF